MVGLQAELIIASAKRLTLNSRVVRNCPERRPRAIKEVHVDGEPEVAWLELRSRAQIRRQFLPSCCPVFILFFKAYLAKDAVGDGHIGSGEDRDVLELARRRLTGRTAYECIRQRRDEMDGAVDHLHSRTGPAKATHVAECLPVLFWIVEGGTG